MSCKKNSLFDHPLILDPSNQFYINRVSGEKYDRVSRVLDNIQEAFDRDMISWAMAKSQCKLAGTENDEEISLKREMILNEWESTSSKSLDYGNLVDSVIERYLVEGTKSIGFEKMLDRMEKEIFSQYKTSSCQQLVYLDEQRVAGAVDYIGLTGRKYLSIYDWKTSLSKGEVELYSKRNKQFKDPVRHLSDCGYNRYGLQTSCYGYMLQEQFGYRVRDINIVFVPEVEPENFKIIPVPFMLTDAKAIMRHYNLVKKVFELNDSDGF
jgi:hypothetical protein